VGQVELLSADRPAQPGRPDLPDPPAL